jgi:L-lactate dehydrogenase complex protein LldF
MHNENANTLPYASSLCGACFDACPVGIDIPEVLIYLRGKTNKPFVEASGMKAMAWAFSDPGHFGLAIKLARIGQGPLVHEGMIRWLPGMLGGWTTARDMPAVPKQSFREWWQSRGEDGRQG